MNRCVTRLAVPLILAAVMAAGCASRSTTTPAASPRSPAASATSATASTSSPSSVAPASAFPVTLTDDDGVSVTLKAPPQRIVTFAPANTEILFALGLGDRVVGVSGRYDNYPPAARQIEEVGGSTGVAPNIEKVVSLQPDLLLATSGGEDWKQRLRQVGVTVFSIDATSFDDVLHDIQTVGKLTGAEQPAAALAANMAAEAAEIKARVAAAPAVSCFYEVYYQPPVYTVGPGSFVFSLLKLAGCDPVTANLNTQYPQMSVEAIVRADPDVYLVDSLSAPSVAAVAKRPGYDALSAVRDQRVVFIDSDLVTRPGPRVVDGLRELADALHPSSG
ncbi:MAG: helical backbone metal receptor [Actinomycetota bacterium]|nr:helical backbone metal receptor [Actinomycetota bacterium]